MALTFIPDTVEGSEIDITSARPTKTRGGLVTGINGDPATALDQILAACTAAGFALGSTATFGGVTVYLHRIVARTFSDDSARVQLIYDSDFGGTSTAYIITFQGYEQAYQNNRLPGTRIPLLVPKWTDPADANNSVQADLATATFSYPMRQVTVSGIKIGSPPAPGTYDGFIGYGNASTFLGLPVGYWKIVSGGSSISKYSGYYSYNLSAVTKNIEDWSQIFTLFNHKAQIYVTIAATNDASLKSPAYSNGIIASVPGGLRVGPYPLTNYFSLFGFS